MEGLSVKDLSPSAGLFESKFSVLGNEVLQVKYLYHCVIISSLLPCHDTTQRT